MFFFKRKKLIEIESKIDSLLQILENQSQVIDDMEKRNRQFLYELLNEKIEVLSGENQCRMEVIEAEFKDSKAEISASVKQCGEAIKDLCKGQKQHDNVVKKELNVIKQKIEEEQKVKTEIVDKLELVENEIRMLLVNSVMDQLP